MAEHYRFFDAVETNGQYDREYNAQEFTDYFKALVTTGVMKGAGNQLGVTANGSNMVTSINTGIAFILGRYYENDAPLTFTHDTETLGLNRIDRIVIRMDQNVDARHVKAFLKKGTASTNPTPPALTQNNTVYEISLAQVRITGGQTFIAANTVTDERGTNVICPWAGSNILPNFNDAALQDLVNSVGVIEDKLYTTQNVTIGNGATTANNDSIAIGKQTTSVGRGIAVGSQAKATNGSAIALGYNASSGGSFSIAIGATVSAINPEEGKLGIDTTNWIVPGDFSVSGTKNFEISHPHPDKKPTHVIRHGAVESPTSGDTLYRYEIEATETNQTIELHLPDYFEHLNTNVDVWVNPHLHFGRAFGIVENGILKVTCETSGKYKALVIGTRNDDNVQDWYVKGVEREIGESWLGETYAFDVDEISEVIEIEGVNV